MVNFALREKLRHYNEVEHELNTRLNRSYKFASRYMEQFVSPLVELNAKFLAFIAAAFFTVLFVFSAWDEDVLNVRFPNFPSIFNLLILFRLSTF